MSETNFTASDGTEYNYTIYENYGIVYGNLFANDRLILQDFIGHSIPLADQIRDQIPWDALDSEIQWVAMGYDGTWLAWRGAGEPTMNEANMRAWLESDWCLPWPIRLKGVKMPEVDKSKWMQTLVERPQ